MNSKNMHGEKIKIINAKQARLSNTYKNTKYKLLRTNATIWYNKMCKMRQVIPGYIHIRINGGRQRDDSKITNQAVRHRINQELKFLYKNILCMSWCKYEFKKHALRKDKGKLFIWAKFKFEEDYVTSVNLCFAL